MLSVAQHHRIVIEIYKTPEMLRLVPQLLAIADDRTDADRFATRRLLARYLALAVPLLRFADEMGTLSRN